MNELSYSLGASVAFNLKSQGIKIDSITDFMQALEGVLSDAPLAITDEKIGEILNSYFQELQDKTIKAIKQQGELFFAENAKREGVISLESGLQYEVITAGKGEKPGPEDVVTTHYHGTFLDGNVFDSSVQRAQPASFPVNGVIAGWTEALQLMEVGSKWKLYIPYHLAYGEHGHGQAIPPYTALIFEVELLEVKK